MSELTSQLGVNWKLLLSQGVNFFIVLGILTVFVWRPLLEVMRARREKIERGLEDARLAQGELERAQEMVSGRMAEADLKAIELIREAEKKAAERATIMTNLAEKKAEMMLSDAKNIAQQREEEEFKKFAYGAGSIVRAALAKAVAEDPQKVDEKMIADAVTFIKKQRAS